MSGAYGGGKKLKSKTFKDGDGAQLFVMRGLTPGTFLFDTDPGVACVDSVVSLTADQVLELIGFIRE